MEEETNTGMPGLKWSVTTVSNSISNTWKRNFSYQVEFFRRNIIVKESIIT